MIPFSRSCILAITTLGLIIFSQLIASTTTLAQETEQSTPPASGPTSEIEKVVRDYILKNPEVIVEALQIFEQRQEAEFNERQKSLIASNHDVLVSSAHQSILGNPDGDVTLIEFFDYNCGFCRDSLEHLQKLVAEDDKLKIVLKEFPVLGPDSQDAARVAIAASKIDPDKYLKLHVQLLKTRGQANKRIALSIAEQLDYDMDALRGKMSETVIDESINEVYGLANQLGLTGTPTFIIGNEVMPGAVGHDVLREKLDSMRKCGETVCS